MKQKNENKKKKLDLPQNKRARARKKNRKNLKMKKITKESKKNLEHSLQVLRTEKDAAEEKFQSDLTDVLQYQDRLRQRLAERYLLYFIVHHFTKKMSEKRV